MDLKKDIREYIQLERDVLSGLDIDAIAQYIVIMEKALKEEKCIYVFGNGGSAATASHMQNDYNKGLSEQSDKKFWFYCLNDNIATLTAIANDYTYEEVYRQQLIGRLKKEDIVLAISGSGNSPNIIRAIEYAKEIGCFTIGFSGFDGGELGKLVDLHIHANVNSMQVAEDIHMIMDHLTMSVLSKRICGKDQIGNE